MSKYNNKKQDELDSILGQNPSWMMHWGMVALLILMLFLAILSWFVKYPDVINAPLALQTKTPFLTVSTLNSGRIGQIFIKNNQKVEKGEKVLILESDTNLDDIEKLKSFLKELSNFESAPPLKFDFPQNLKLGDLNNEVANLELKTKKWSFQTHQNFTNSKLSSNEQQLLFYDNLNQNFEDQLLILEDEIALAKSNLERNEDLNRSGEFSILQLEEAKVNFLIKKRALEIMKSQKVQNQIEMENLKSQSFSIRENDQEANFQNMLMVKESIKNLLNSIDNWEKNHLFRAPINGIVVFKSELKTVQFVEKGEALFHILPENTDETEIVGKALLPIKNSGKVQLGQLANIFLEGYPFKEFGVIKSEVTSIGQMPQNDFIQIELKLTNGLLTSYHKSIPFSQNMSGKVEIITKDKRLFERFFDQINSIIKNN